jgi:uncharacterized protein
MSAMRSDLDHLPHGKQRELQRVTEILFEEFTDAMKCASSPKKKEGRILKIVLFGSYARGTWVDEPHTAKGYLSDYDLLIVVNQQSVVDFATYWYRANNALAQGQYFFSDIIREGIALYNLKGSTRFVTPKPQTAEEAVATAEQHFQEWFPRIEQALRGAKFYKAEHNLRDAAFTLHQAVERAYTILLLVETSYSPSTHSIKFLRSLAEQIDPELIAVWPRETKHDRRLFELLKRAYVDARYSEHYAITAEELVWLGERAEILRTLVETRSREKIGQLRAGAPTGI